MSQSWGRRALTCARDGKLWTGSGPAKDGLEEGNSYGLVVALLAEGRRSGALQLLARLATIGRAVGREMFPGERPKR